MIRLEGAETLCNSLRTNKILTNLDLSYNALGSAAAGVLGAALMENNVSLSLRCVHGVYCRTAAFSVTGVGVKALHSALMTPFYLAK